jgi:hypothetical protein
LWVEYCLINKSIFVNISVRYVEDAEGDFSECLVACLPINHSTNAWAGDSEDEELVYDSGDEVLVRPNTKLCSSAPLVKETQTDIGLEECTLLLDSSKRIKVDVASEAVPHAMLDSGKVDFRCQFYGRGRMNRRIQTSLCSCPSPAFKCVSVQCEDLVIPKSVVDAEMQSELIGTLSQEIQTDELERNEKGVQVDLSVSMSPLHSTAIAGEMSFGVTDVLLASAIHGVDTAIVGSPLTEIVRSPPHKKKRELDEIVSLSGATNVAVKENRCYSPISPVGSDVSPAAEGESEEGVGLSYMTPFSSSSSFTAVTMGGNCRFCLQPFPRKSLRLQHEQLCVTSPWSRDSFVCPRCGFACLNAMEMDQHQMSCI